MFASYVTARVDNIVVIALCAITNITRILLLTLRSIARLVLLLLCLVALPFSASANRECDDFNISVGQKKIGVAYLKFLKSIPEHDDRIKLLNGVMSSLPCDRIELTRIIISESNALEIIGREKSGFGISLFMRNLDRTGLFRSIDWNGAKSIKDEGGAYVVSFTILLTPR